MRIRSMHRSRSRYRRFLLIAACLVLVVPLPVHGTALAALARSDSLEIKVLSNRADLVSGGDALVEVVLPTDADPDKVGVDVDGRDVTSDFAVRSNGRFMGLVTGLVEGDNDLGPV